MPVEYKAPNGETKHLGQQCTYDGKGSYITNGPAAGSVDAVSPAESVSRHFNDDVLPSLALSREEYSQYRPTNNGNNCKPNPPLQKPFEEKVPDERSPEEPLAEEKTGSLINEEVQPNDEVEAFLNEKNSAEIEGEGFIEDSFAESEGESFSEMSMGGA